VVGKDGIAGPAAIGCIGSVTGGAGGPAAGMRACEIQDWSRGREQLNLGAPPLVHGERFLQDPLKDFRAAAGPSLAPLWGGSGAVEIPFTAMHIFAQTTDVQLVH
jgi:hypothetical protein